MFDMIYLNPRFCTWCGEEIEEPIRSKLAQQLKMHNFCAMRSIIGSLAHQQHRCKCYGFEEEIDGNFTLREEAKIAVEYYLRNSGESS